MATSQADRWSRIAGHMRRIVLFTAFVFLKLGLDMSRVIMEAA
jgi:hypothetical protein